MILRKLVLVALLAGVSTLFTPFKTLLMQLAAFSHRYYNSKCIFCVAYSHKNACIPKIMHVFWLVFFFMLMLLRNSFINFCNKETPKMNNTHKLFMQIKRLSKLALLKVRKGRAMEKVNELFHMYKYKNVKIIIMPSLRKNLFLKSTFTINLNNIWYPIKYDFIKIFIKEIHLNG